MSPPPTKKEVWDRLEEYAAVAEMDRIAALSPEELDAERAALAASRAAAANPASPIALVPQPATPAPQAPTNVVPFARKPRRATWTVTLLAAALAAALAITTATMIARKDPTPKPHSPNAPSPQVFVEVQHEKIEALRATAEGAERSRDWNLCLTSLDKADSYVTRPPPEPDLLRKGCADGAIADFRVQAQDAAKAKNWRACLVSIAAAQAIRKDPADGLDELDAFCTKRLGQENMVKKP
jgi:hypothetical protein